jgi:cytochrome c-type biogenesis protein CcmF
LWLIGGIFLVLNVLRTDDVEIVGLYYRVILSWALWSWGWLTVGITLGSWWAYRELGWGGYWFWDPVENAALMPWLCVTALIHALRIEGQGKRDWVCIAGGSAFVLAIFGGFITRSGVLVSVHGFARDRLHGLLLMAMVVYACILVCVHWGRRQNDCVEKKECNNKSISLISQNKILLSMGFIVWFGTVYPILIAWFTDDMMTVGAGYFQQVLEPIFLLLLWALARSLGKIGAVRQFIIYAFSLGVSFVINTVMGGGMVVVDMWAVVIIAVLVSLIMRLLLHHLEHQALLNRSLVGHMAFLLLFLCIYINHAYTTESMGLLEKGKSSQFGHFQVHLLEVKRQQTERVDEETLFIQVDDGKQKYPLEPVIKRFKKRDIWKSKAAIRHSVWGDSMAIVVKESQNQYAIRIHQKPLQSIFWLCGLVMGFLGIASGYELQRVRRGQ